MIDIAVLRAMVAAGATGEMLLSAIEADQKIEIVKIDARRAKDAERQRRRRAVTRSHADSHPVTRTQRDAPAYIEEERKKESKEVEKPKRVSLPAHALPTTWTLDEQDRAYARSKGWDVGRTDHEGERFRNHAEQSGRTAKNWHAAWRNWVTSPFQKPPQHGENQNGKSIIAACDRAIDHFRANGATGDYVPGSSGPKPLRVDLPSGPSGIRSLPKG